MRLSNYLNSSPGTLCITSSQIIRPKLRRQDYFDAVPLRHSLPIPKPFSRFKSDKYKHSSQPSGSRPPGAKRRSRQKEKTKKPSCMTFLCMITVKNKTVGHTFLLSFDNTNGHFCQDRLLRSRNLATMVTWRHFSHLFLIPVITIPKYNWGTALPVFFCNAGE